MTAGVNEMLNKHHLRRVAIKGGHSKQDLWYTQTPLHLSIFTTIYWSYLLWSPVIVLHTFKAPREKHRLWLTLLICVQVPRYMLFRSFRA